MAAKGGAYFPYISLDIEKIKIIFFTETAGPIQYYLAGMFFWWPSTQIVQAVMIHQKTWLLWGAAYFPYIYI